MIQLITFDIFGTVLDWRRGLAESCAAAGRPLRDGEFDRVVDHQGASEQRAFQRYRQITSRSLIDVLGLAPDKADSIGASLGHWPLFADSPAAMARLQKIARCAATTNSDLAHRAGVEAQLQQPMDGWICAEEVGAYKPDVRVWQHASKAMNVPFSRDWWHVSAYADYDLKTAMELGLTCVFVQRPHARPGPHHLAVRDLAELAEVASR
ncbi:MAG: HAD-IA family hydrolase [Deltaproteobacteria bacterium]|nr:HAD-IA family hydrolase [Deltaproteobacteria bacterium]